LAPSGVIGRVTFTYSEPHRCSAAVNGVASTEYIGSQSDYRDSKKRYSGIRPLSTITVESFGHPTDRNTRTISLTQNWAGTSSVSTDYSESGGSGQTREHHYCIGALQPGVVVHCGSYSNANCRVTPVIKLGCAITIVG
jgi:hypothetical protein